MIKANKEIAEKEIKAIIENVEKETKTNEDLIQANKEISIEMIKDYGASIENLILKKDSAITSK